MGNAEEGYVHMRNAFLGGHFVPDMAGLAATLQADGVKIYSHGETARELRRVGITSMDIGEYGDNPHLVDPVNQDLPLLNPKVHGSVLYRRGNDQDEKDAAANGIVPFDVVAVNLRPLKADITSPEGLSHMLNSIDVPILALARGAAKNHASVLVMTDPKDYNWAAMCIDAHTGIELSARRQLAGKVFQQTAAYYQRVQEVLEDALARVQVESLDSMTGRVSVGNALVSVWYKEGIVDMARMLHERSVPLYSSGGTAKKLNGEGVPVIDVAAFTGYPPLFNHRVVTLHERIHAGILARRNNLGEMAELRNLGGVPFGLVVNNLYPVQEAIAKPGTKIEDVVEQTDIGGPTLIANAAKNCLYVGAVIDSRDYMRIAETALSQRGLEARTRLELAAKVFSTMAAYDQAIAGFYQQVAPLVSTARFTASRSV